MHCFTSPTSSASSGSSVSWPVKRSCSRDRSQRVGVTQIQIVDRWYGIFAGLVIITGLALVFFGAKGSVYYAHNAIFWVKMTLFVTVAIVSIVPTVAYLRWNQRKAADGSILLDEGEYSRLRAFLWVQIGLLVLIPLCAALMANGVSIT